MASVSELAEHITGLAGGRTTAPWRVDGWSVGQGSPGVRAPTTS